MAAFAATASAFADVSIIGYYDRGYLNTSNTKSDGTKSAVTVGSNAGTTALKFIGTEDLGGGLSAGFMIENDFADNGGATQAAGYNTAQATGVANGETFVSLTSATAGTVKLGDPNNFTLTNVTGVGSPAFSTGVGSAYSSHFSIANGIGTGSTGYGGVAILNANGATNGGARAIRIANTVQYISPMISGVQASVGITPANNNVASGTPGNTVGVTEYALRYTAGALDTMFTSIKYTVGGNGTQLNIIDASSGTFSTKTLTGGFTNTQNFLGATYALNGGVKLHGGYGTFSSSDQSQTGKSNQVGVTYTVGNVDYLGQIVRVTDNAATAYNRSLTGLGVNYNLSKTTKVYFRYDNQNYNTAAASSGSKETRSAVGVAINF